MCPSCLSNKVRISHLRWRDLPLLFVRIPPSRCLACHRRFYAWPWLEAPHSRAACRHRRTLLSRWSPRIYRRPRVTTVN